MADYSLQDHDLQVLTIWGFACSMQFPCMWSSKSHEIEKQRMSMVVYAMDQA